ncbi:beta-galactosidase GanA [Nakamurella sp. UYEF19]|uniref:beta-galactosidase n=1 Tax=Nakamurella sp. UYEF19 TaxID=1756392 RepID=UPI00339AC46A
MHVQRLRHAWLRRALALVCATVLVTGLMASLPTTVAAASIPPAPSANTAPVAKAPAAPASHTITYDSGSLKIDGQRLMIFSGEFAYWRLPSTSLWLDMLQKMKANGYNAISIYFDWAYHSPKSGVYDFAGVRDVDLLLDMAQQVGLYVIARPGPYINAETDAGGFPSWLINVAGKGRTDAPDYLAAVDQWMTRIDTILARHQLTNGTGTVILDQIENELSTTGTTQKNYMQHLFDKAKGDGITVPIFHNDKGRNGIWVPTSSTVSGTVQGPNDMYAFDGYPGGTCSTNATVGSPSTAPDWGLWGAGGATGGASASPNTPGFAAEFGGGWFDYWGSQGTYDCTAQREGPGYERVFYETNVANGLSIQNFYMTFGGTSWGWLPAPVVYTSYDYGAAFSESRQIRPKATTMKELGLFLQSVDVPTDLTKSEVITPSSTAVKVYHDVNAETGAHLYVAMHNPSSATTNDTFTFPITTPDGSYTIPQAGALHLNGQDSKMLVSNYALDGQHLVYSTSEIMTHFARSDGGTALLYGRNGETGETVLRYTSQPTVQVLAGTVSSTWDTTKGDLRLDYTHTGLAQVRISGGGRPTLTLLLADQDTADSFWRQDTVAGPVLERGPELVRTATVDGSTLKLTGDTSNASDLQVWAPSGVTAVTWNGATVPVTTGPTGDLSATRQLSAPPAVTLPDLTQATWSYAPGSPESDPSFDDAGWTAADHTTTTSTTPPPAGAPVLTEDDYGFHQGDVWYRGSYTGTAAATTLGLNYGAGGAGMLQVWLDGVYLGQNVLPSGVSAPPTTGTAKFTIPDSLRTGNHVLAVMVRNDGHNEDGGVNDAYKEGRGLISVTTTGAAGTVTTPISWKIQGTLSGEDTPDTARGSNNVGGSYGERNGWYLPGFPDSSWTTTTVPAATAMPGTSWYRTTFSLDEPTGVDASLGLTIGNPAVPQSTGNYRALIYLNGWNIGQYIANVGPQHTFVMPNGILNPNGQNTLAISVTSDGGAGNGLEAVGLTDLGTVAGGVPVTMNTAPDWSAAVYGTLATAGEVSVDSMTSDASNTTKGGDVIHVNAGVTNRTTATVTGATVTLSTPTGWNAIPTGTTTLPDLVAGDSKTVSWTVTVPQATTVGSYQVAASVTAPIGGKNETSGRTLLFPVRNAGDIYISDMPWVSSISGYGTIGRDVSVGGGPLTMNSVVYPKGVGVNAISTVVVAPPSGCTSFTSTVGLDIGSGGKGSVTFAVIGDGVTLAQTATIAGTTAPIPLTVDITGVTQLTLTAGDGGNGNGHDNADWGNAEIHCTVRAAPTITMISPPVVPVAGGAIVTLTGTGFASDATVSVDGSAEITPASISSDGTSLAFAAPAHVGGTVAVTVKTSAGTSTATDLGYRAAPTTTGVSPSHGTTDGGTVVTLTGTGYTDDATVSVDGGAPITPTSLSGDINSSTSTLTFTAPAHPAGPVGVVVTTPGGNAAAATYTYDGPANPGPTVIPVPPAPVWTDACGVDNGSFSGYADTSQYSWKVTDHSRLDGKVGIVVTAADGFAFPAGARVQWTQAQDNSRCDASITATTTAQTCAGAVPVPGSLMLDETGIRVAYVYAGAVTGTKAGNLSKLAPGQYLIIATAADGSAFNAVPAGWKPSPTTDADGNIVKVSRVVTVQSTNCTRTS